MSSEWKAFFAGLKPGKGAVLALSFLLLTAAGLFYAVHETTKATVTISKGEEEMNVETHADTVGAMLEEQNLKVEEKDELSSSLTDPIVGNMELEWNPAKQITISEDGEETKVWTTASTVKEAMEEQDIDIGAHDEVNKEIDAPVQEGMTLVYESAFPVTVQYDEESEEVMTTSTTVADLLKEVDVNLDDNDRVEPGKQKDISAEAEIEVIRVEKVTDVVEEEVDYATVTRRDDALAKGKEQVLESGRKGLVRKEYEVVMENGEEVSRELVEETQVEESKDKVVAVGAREQTATAARGESPSGSNAEGQTISMHATAYTADCSGCSGVTATGVNLNANPNRKVVAVDPSVIPLGTRVHVEGYGEATAADTGGAISGNRIDLHVPTKQEANSFGRKTVDVTILD
ncbi:G5 and 3D domain-containing protein [Salibacterium aidingense]|uniref:G5 and 3D domain-containing protein n=1 Tax=Salibacterium aidingense TaxID=384933 RepID=UPI00041A61FF|nr:G5 and 3D domain-containing protein [Salibacterium aidingense]